MNKTKRTTANLPESLLTQATKASGLSITETLILGLELVKKSKAYDKAQALVGKLDLEIDINTSRERSGS